MIGCSRRGVPSHGHPVIGHDVRAQLPGQPSERALERLAVVGRAPETVEHAASFVRRAPHDGEGLVEARAVRRSLRQLVHGQMELHGRAQESLQERVVQLLRDARALLQPFVRAGVELPRELPQAMAVEPTAPSTATTKQATRNHRVFHQGGTPSVTVTAATPPPIPGRAGVRARGR